jgi:hypothetical protein
MNHLKSAIVVVLVTGSAVALIAGADDTKKTADKAKDVISVSGCVTAGTQEDQYLLTKAALVPAVVPTTTGTSGDAKVEAVPAAMESPTSYALKGGSLKAHLGHQVEVTGKLTEHTKPRIATTPASTAAAPADAAPASTIDVRSVKMVSATCP